MLTGSWRICEVKPLAYVLKVREDSLVDKNNNKTGDRYASRARDDGRATSINRRQEQGRYDQQYYTSLAHNAWHDTVEGLLEEAKLLLMETMA